MRNERTVVVAIETFQINFSFSHLHPAEYPRGIKKKKKKKKNRKEIIIFREENREERVLRISRGSIDRSRSWNEKMAIERARRKMAVTDGDGHTDYAAEFF